MFTNSNVIKCSFLFLYTDNFDVFKNTLTLEPIFLPMLRNQWRINRLLYELKMKRKWRDCISWFGTITSQDLLIHSSSAVGATFRVNRNKKEFLKWKTIFSRSEFYTSCRMLHIVWCQITPHRMSHFYAWLSLPVRTKHPLADIYINTFEMDRFFSSCRENSLVNKWEKCE